MIFVRNVKKTYRGSGSEIALNDVSVSFEEGLIHGIIGMSGAGKSTLIRLINLLEDYDEGTLSVFDYKDVKKLNKESTRMLRLQVSMIFQSDHLLSRKTVLDNVLLPLSFHKKITDEDRDYALDLLKEVGLEEYVNRYPAHLSGGQRQRVGIARALVNKPKLLLCDEPTSALDVITTSTILKLIKDVSKNHQCNVLIVTHDMKVIKEICDTVTVMDQGKIIERGFVDDILYKSKEDETRRFIKDIGLDIKGLLVDYNKNDLLFLKFNKDNVGDSIVSSLSKDLNVGVSILYAHITPNNTGVMLLHTPDKKTEIKEYLIKKEVNVSDI